MRSAKPRMIPARGVPVPQSRAVHTPASTPAISGASAVFRGFRPASLPTATTRDRGRLSLIATIRQEVGQNATTEPALATPSGGGEVGATRSARGKSDV
jgi:hypothetical protein